MTQRLITVAGAQLGPIQKAEGRDVAVGRMVRLMERAHQRGAQVVVFPELALTTFFPRWYEEDIANADHWYETALPSNETAPLFEAARKYGIAFHLGYAEKTPDGRRFNTAVFVHPSGEIVLKYRKIHLPGHKEYDPIRQVQHLEKRYFEIGDLGFPVTRAPIGEQQVNVGMLICNDRRWPEAWRVLGLQQVELVMLGYNTPSINQDRRGFEAHHLRVLHSHLSIQSGCYQNACYAVAVAKALLKSSAGPAFAAVAPIASRRTVASRFPCRIMGVLPGRQWAGRCPCRRGNIRRRGRVRPAARAGFRAPGCCRT